MLSASTDGARCVEHGVTAAYANFVRADGGTTRLNPVSRALPPARRFVFSPPSPLETRFAAGDESALAELYERHGSLVYTFCRRQLGSEGGRDATQEVFVAAWKARRRFDPERGSLRPWLMGIAKNKIVDAIRYRSRRPDTVGGVELDDGPLAPAVLSSTDQMADRMVLASALEELPERARRAVELSFFGQMTHPEIAAETGLPLGTVKSDIRRGLVKLRRHLASRSSNSNTGSLALAGGGRA